MPRPTSMFTAFALPGIAAFEFYLERFADRGFVECPRGADEIVGGSFPADSFNDDVGWGELEEVDERRDVVPQRHHLEFAPFDLLAHRRVFHGVEIVDFHGIDADSGKFTGSCQHVVMRFAREAEYHVSANLESLVTTPLHRVEERVVMMASIHPVEGPIVNRLHPVLDGQFRLASHLFQQLHHVLGDTIGTGANRHADHFGMRERLFIERTKTLHGGVGVRGWLKVGDEVVAFVSQLQTPNPLIDLVENALLGQPSTGAETPIVAKDATALGNRSIDVGASEPSVDADPLHAAAEFLPKLKVVAIHPQTGRPPVEHRFVCTD